eukprot:2017020-Rhodomonas_salina.1
MCIRDSPSPLLSPPPSPSLSGAAARAARGTVQEALSTYSSKSNTRERIPGTICTENVCRTRLSASERTPWKLRAEVSVPCFSDVLPSRSGMLPLHPETKYKKLHFQYNLYQECGFLYLRMQYTSRVPLPRRRNFKPFEVPASLLVGPY